MVGFTKTPGTLYTYFTPHPAPANTTCPRLTGVYMINAPLPTRLFVDSTVTTSVHRKCTPAYIHRRVAMAGYPDII